MNNTALQGLSYYVKTYGCQMNLSDSEKVSGMLDAAGAYPVSSFEEANIVVFMTCCVREAADVRLYGQVASIKNMPAPDGGVRCIAVGGCIGQRDAEHLIEKLPHVDVVFGTHTFKDITALIAEAIQTDQPVVAIDEASGDSQAELPVHREHDFRAWLPIITGCNNFCTFCIVPHVRGREHSYSMEMLIADATLMKAQGVREITLLGQNVNSYGRDRYGEPQFAKLLHEVGKTGIERIRFVTSHPKDLLDETIEAMAEVDAVMPALHLAVQSGSDGVLKRMNRRYTAEHYLSLVDKVRTAIPDIALSTDIIVGFPGETEDDFEATLELARKVGYAQAFTFIYSKRENTRAARFKDQLDREVVQERFDRLVAVIQESAYAYNQQFDKQTVEVLVEGTSKRDEQVLTGRSRHDQTVNFVLPASCPQATPADLVGKIVNVTVESAKTWYLAGTMIDGSVR